MKVTIHTTQNILTYQGDILKIQLPTEQGNKTLPESTSPAIYKLAPWVLSIFETETSIKKISISKGIALCDGKNLRITTSTATTTPLEKLTQLRSNQYLLEFKLQKLKSQGNIEDINNLILELEKVKADIQLAQA